MDCNATIYTWIQIIIPASDAFSFQSSDVDDTEASDMDRIFLCNTSQYPFGYAMTFSKKAVADQLTQY